MDKVTSDVSGLPDAMVQLKHQNGLLVQLGTKYRIGSNMLFGQHCAVILLLNQFWAVLFIENEPRWHWHRFQLDEFLATGPPLRAASPRTCRAGAAATIPARQSRCLQQSFACSAYPRSFVPGQAARDPVRPAPIQPVRNGPFGKSTQSGILISNASMCFPGLVSTVPAAER